MDFPAAPADTNARKRTHEMSTDDASCSNLIPNPDSSTTAPKQRRTRKPFSLIFDFNLDENKEKFATCKSCKPEPNTEKRTIIKMKDGNTTGLQRHLKQYHFVEYLQMYPEKNAETKVFSQDVLNDMLVDWISKKYLPISFFDDVSTKELFRYLNEKASIPDRNKMHSMVHARYSAMRGAVLKILRENRSKISFTLDGWTSIANKSYYGITGHFIDEQWQLRSLVIDFSPSNGRHTGKDIASVFYETLQACGLEDKCQGITVDNAAANTTFMKELTKLTRSGGTACFNSEDQHFRCFAHILNLAAQDLIAVLKVGPDGDTDIKESSETVEDVSCNEGNPVNAVTKLRTLFKRIKHSEQWHNKLKSCCETFGINMLSPNIDVATRWNSTHSMIDTANRMQSALNLLCDINDSLKTLRISSAEWVLLTRVDKYLRYFKTLSDALGGEKYVTLPLVVVGFNMLLDKIESSILNLETKSDKDEIDISLQEALGMAQKKLLKHYEKSNWVYCAILILDPRHKTETFNLTSWGREMAKESLKKFEDIFRDYYSFKNIQEPSVAQNTPLSSLDQAEQVEQTEDDDLDLNSLFERNTSNYDFPPEGERADKDVNILCWWCQNESRYPVLSCMARDFLSIPATSVPAERLFSRASLTIRKHRNRLSSESAKALLCLNSWATCDLRSKILTFVNL